MAIIIFGWIFLPPPPKALKLIASVVTRREWKQPITGLRQLTIIAANGGGGEMEGERKIIIDYARGESILGSCRTRDPDH